MEFANHWPDVNKEANGTRVALPEDSAHIMKLLQTAVFNHVHTDWHFPIDWLGSSTFVVHLRPHHTISLSEQLFGFRSALQGCLAATADPPPAAWVRLAAIANNDQPIEILAAMMSHVVNNLQKADVSQLAWMTDDPWFTQRLPDLGFQAYNQIAAYLKTDLSIPPLPTIAGLSIRPVSLEDMGQLAAMEIKAFGPLWRHSVESLILALKQSFSFDVARLNEQIVGFQISTCSRLHAHLVRLTISPEVQRQGIGSALLAHAIMGYRHYGLQSISLNTQIDNRASQYLYQKFGFYANGQRFPIWIMTL